MTYIDHILAQAVMRGSQQAHCTRLVRTEWSSQLANLATAASLKWSCSSRHEGSAQIWIFEVQIGDHHIAVARTLEEFATVISASVLSQQDWRRICYMLKGGAI